MSDLTPAQIETLEVYRSFWRKLAISTERVDKSSAKRAIQCLYGAINKAEPEFLWFDSPSDAALAAQILLIEQDPEFFERYWGQLV